MLLEKGVRTSYLRVRSLPSTASTLHFIQDHEQLFVVENNFEGQLKKIMANLSPHEAPKLVKVAKCDGLPLAAKWIANSIYEQIV